jgi:UDP:flavonoid glycosyltransferase YjiC (YdhE family)
MALEGLAKAPYQIIATIPADVLGPLPPNAVVLPFIPHAMLLSRAVCMVCHGGSGVTHKALAFGVPVVAVPDAYDRFEVARRVEVARAGVMIPAARAAPESFRLGVEEAIKRRPGAERIADSFRAAGGASTAADAVEQLMARWGGFGDQAGRRQRNT